MCIQIAGKNAGLIPARLLKVSLQIPPPPVPLNLTTQTGDKWIPEPQLVTHPTVKCTVTGGGGTWRGTCNHMAGTRHASFSPYLNTHSILCLFLKWQTRQPCAAAHRRPIYQPLFLPALKAHTLGMTHWNVHV